jgi:hypothetical protein
MESQQDRSRSKLQLAMQVAREEQDELSGRVATPALLQYNRNTDSRVMEDKQKQYMQQNKATFSDLVSQARSRGRQMVTVSQSHTATDPAVSQSRTTDKPATSHTATEPARDSVTIMSSSSKRSLPSLPVFSSPRKRSKSGEEAENEGTMTPRKTPPKGVSALYVTPTKAALTELARSPRLKTVNIIDQLNMTMEKTKRSSKAPCPVCGLQVTEKFLNIHLDKCLKASESEPSPVFTKARKRTVVKVVNPFLVDDDSLEDSQESIDLSDFLEQSRESDKINMTDEAAARSHPKRRPIVIDDEDNVEYPETRGPSPSLLGDLSDDFPSSPLRFSESLSQHSWGPGEKEWGWEKGRRE